MESNKNEQNVVPEDETLEKRTENAVIKSVLEDWDDLNKDFTQLQVQNIFYLYLKFEPVPNRNIISDRF